jgi:hypothetical protein
MNKLTLIIILISFVLGGCGGLKHIKLNQKSDTDWKIEDCKQQDQKTNK